MCVYAHVRAHSCIWVHMSIGARGAGLLIAGEPGSCASAAMSTKDSSQATLPWGLNCWSSVPETDEQFLKLYDGYVCFFLGELPAWFTRQFMGWMIRKFIGCCFSIQQFIINPRHECPVCLVAEDASPILLMASSILLINFPLPCRRL